MRDRWALGRDVGHLLRDVFLSRVPLNELPFSFRPFLRFSPAT